MQAIKVGYGFCLGLDFGKITPKMPHNLAKNLTKSSHQDLPLCQMKKSPKILKRFHAILKRYK
ncbi:hypothetical protein [Helicobacter sp. T3_23-1056]